MRNKLSIFLVGALVMGLASLGSMANAQEQAAQLVWVEDVIVKPSMAAKYENYVKEWLKLAAEYDFPYAFETFVTDDFHYYFIIYADDYNTHGSLLKAIEEWAGRVGEKDFQAMMKLSEGTFVSINIGYYLLRPDLSYIPEKPRYDLEDTNFWLLVFDYVESGKEAVYEEIFKEIKSLSERMNNEIAYNIFVGDLGAQTPVYVLSFMGKDAGEFYTNYAKEAQRLNEKIGPLVQKLMGQVRMRDVKAETARSDLSYKPEKK